MGMMTIKELASKYNVTTMAVRFWIKKHNLPYDFERVVGVRPRIIIDEKHIENIFVKDNKK